MPEQRQKILRVKVNKVRDMEIMIKTLVLGSALITYACNPSS